MFICMVGPPGSGKSYCAKQLSEWYRCKVVSTDEIRKELWGDEADQRQPWIVFRTAYDRINDELQSGRTVIFDATNISRKNRRQILKKISWYRGAKFAYAMTTLMDEAKSRNAARERKVEDEVIERMYKLYEIPDKSEGWDDVRFLNN